MSENLDKKIHAEDLFINGYKFNQLKEDDSDEIAKFTQYQSDYGKLHDVVEILQKECRYSGDMWYETIYDNSTVQEILSRLDTNFCASAVNKWHRTLCDACKENLRTVAYYNSIKDIANIVDDWGDIVVPDEFVHEPIKKARVKTITVPDGWKVFNEFPFDYIRSLQPYADEIKKHDVVDFGFYSRWPLEEVLAFKNLKGIIFRSCSRNLDILEQLPNLEFIQLPRSYDLEMTEKIYGIAWRF